MSDEQLEDAEDGESPRQDIMTLILKHAEALAVAGAKAELQANVKAARAPKDAMIKVAQEEAERVAAQQQVAEAKAAEAAAATALKRTPGDRPRTAHRSQDQVRRTAQASIRMG